MLSTWSFSARYSVPTTHHSAFVKNGYRHRPIIENLNVLPGPAEPVPIFSQTLTTYHNMGNNNVVLARCRLASLWLSQVARGSADSCLSLAVVLQMTSDGQTPTEAAWY